MDVVWEDELAVEVEALNGLVEEVVEREDVLVEDAVTGGAGLVVVVELWSDVVVEVLDAEEEAEVELGDDCVIVMLNEPNAPLLSESPEYIAVIDTVLLVESSYATEQASELSVQVADSGVKEPVVLSLLVKLITSPLVEPIVSARVAEHVVGAPSACDAGVQETVSTGITKLPAMMALPLTVPLPVTKRIEKEFLHIRVCPSNSSVVAFPV